MKKDSRIFVAGHRGLVGSAILKKLKEEGYTNLIIATRQELDLTNQQDTQLFFANKKPEYVFLCAALVGGIHDNNTRRADFIYNNLQIQNNVIHWSKVFGVKKLLYLGSSCIYPKFAKQPIKEEYLLTSELEQTNEPYAIAKIAGIKMCESYRRQYDCNFISVMPTNLYGSECFSDDTEVLTVNGIKNIKDINIGDKVYTLNKDTQNVEIENVMDTQKVKTNEFYNFKSRNCDFRVTPTHKMLFKSRPEYPLIKREAQYFKNKIGKKGYIMLPNNKPIKEGELYKFNLMDYKDEHHIIRDYDNFMRDGKHSRMKYHPSEYDLMDLCHFIGWYVSEGSIVDNMKTKCVGLDCGQIRISQNKNENPDYYNEIDDLLNRLGVNYGKDNYAFYFTSRAFKKFIREEIGVGSSNKKIPKFVFNLPLEYRKVVYESLMKGDGNKSGLRYTTKSTTLKNDFIHLCLTLGIKLGSIYDDGNWRITIIGKTRDMNFSYKGISIDNVDDEDAYCITTEKNHNIFAGRNNKFNWVGQCDNYDLEKSHVFAAMIRKFHDAKMRGDDSVELWGDGSPMREFLHVDDFADASIHLMKNYNEEQPLNVGTGTDITIHDLAHKIKDIIGFNGDIVWNTEKPNGTPRKLLDVSKLHNTGWKHKIELDEGIKTTYEKYLSDNNVTQKPTPKN